MIFPLFQLLLWVGMTSADGRVCWALAGVQAVFQSHRWRHGWLATRFEEMISKARGAPEVITSARINRERAES